MGFLLYVLFYIPFFTYRIKNLKIQHNNAIQTKIKNGFSNDDENNSSIISPNNFNYFNLMSGFNLNKDWLEKSQSQISANINIKSCPKCNFEPTNKKSSFFFENKSDKRDLVMTIYVKSQYGMIVLARSLRTTKSGASIVYFVDSILYTEISKDSETKKLFQSCGITIINYGTAPEPFNSIVNYRFILFCEFMKKYHSKYRKIIIVDGFDTVFQSDPFIEKWKEDVVYLTQENNRNRVTRGWYDRLFVNQNVYDVLNSMIINNGVIAAFSKTMFVYLDFFTRSYDWNKWDDTLDQALVNYLFYKNKFKEAGIKIELFRAGDGFLASIYNFYGSVTNQKLGYFNPRSNNVFPALIHKFSEPRQFGKNVYFQCPRLSWQKNVIEYIRGLSAGEMDIIDKNIN